MSWNQRNKVGQQSTGVVGLTGTAPQSVTGNAVLMRQVQPGTLCAEVYGKGTTTSIVLTGKWQVSNDNSTWRDAYLANRPANVTLVSQAGTNSDTVVISAPDAVYAKRYARFVVTSTAATGGGAGTDEASIAYAYMAPAFVNG